MKVAVIAAAVFVAAVRPFLTMHPASLQGSYEAIAHLLVGGVLGAWIVARQRWLLLTAIGLSVVEIASAAFGLLR